MNLAFFNYGGYAHRHANEIDAADGHVVITDYRTTIRYWKVLTSIYSTQIRDLSFTLIARTGFEL